MEESNLWAGWPARIGGLAVAAVAAAMVGAHTDLIRDLPRISPRMVELDAEMRMLEARMRACEAWQIKHQEMSDRVSAQLTETGARNASEIERLRERIDRALERGR